MNTILYSGDPEQWDAYKKTLQTELNTAGIKLGLTNQINDPKEIEYLLYTPNGTVQNFDNFPNLKLIQSLWAGVDTLVRISKLTIPISRMVEHGLKQGMAEYILGHILRHHLNMDQYLKASPGEWNNTPPPLASERKIGFLGFGTLGLYSAEKVAQFGFSVSAWSRTNKSHPNITCYNTENGLQNILATSDILVLLLPNTKQTKNLINSKRISQMKKGVVLINPARGALIVENDLLDGLNSGQIASATMDVFRTEPLPNTHPFWHHPNILVTPHIASSTRIPFACKAIIENIRRDEAGQDFLNLVDSKTGY